VEDKDYLYKGTTARIEDYWRIGAKDRWN